MGVSMRVLRARTSESMLAAVPATVADGSDEAIGIARKPDHAGDLANAKLSLDLASQLIGQENADSFVADAAAKLPYALAVDGANWR